MKIICVHLCSSADRFLKMPEANNKKFEMNTVDGRELLAAKGAMLIGVIDTAIISILRFCNCIEKNNID